MNKIIIKSPAKINLYLKILNKFTDGYHEIDTAFQLIDLFDEIEFINSKNNISINSNSNNLNNNKLNINTLHFGLTSNQFPLEKIN